MAKTSLKHSKWLEERLIREDLSSGVVEGFRESGLQQYHLRNRDSHGFMHSDPTARLQFAAESGLIPSEI